MSCKGRQVSIVFSKYKQKIIALNKVFKRLYCGVPKPRFAIIQATGLFAVKRVDMPKSLGRYCLGKVDKHCFMLLNKTAFHVVIYSLIRLFVRLSMLG
ncbi:hypothetical protein AYJ00_04665 [Shewanella algae]|nr:hypothetical protein AYJ00_04665 [Shewanella algae]